MKRWLLFDLAVAVVAWLLAAVRWGYPWPLATLTAGALGALAYVTRRTYVNLRQLQTPSADWDDDDP